MASEEHVFKVFIDAMLVDGADLRVFGREVLQFIGVLSVWLIAPGRR